jgi:hypothetical protein
MFVEPFLSPADYVAGHLDAVHVDEPGLKIARISLFRRIADIALIDCRYLVGTTRDGIERHFERHELGLFTEADYRAAFAAAGPGFEALEELALPFGRGLYLGSR